MDNGIIITKQSNGPKKKTPFQLETLEKYYSEDKYPKQKAMEEYAAYLDLAYNSIKIWFSERRRKERWQNGVNGHNKKLLDSKSNCSSMKVGKKMNDNAGRRKSNRLSHSKQKNVIQESDQSMDSILDASSGSYRQNGKQPFSNHKELGYSTSLQSRQSCNPKSTMLQRKYCSISSNNQHVGHTNYLVRPQVLFSKEYILKRVFRKDGPPLGVEFDSPPSSSRFHTDSAMLRSCRDSRRVSKRRKILGAPFVESIEPQLQAVHSKQYGMGKGLMTMWRARNPNNVELPSKFNLDTGDAAWLPFKSSFKETLFRASRGTRQQDLVLKQSTWMRKSQEKKRPLLKRKKVPCSKAMTEKSPRRIECKLAIDQPDLELTSALTQLLDDEELELREVQTGPNPLRCSVHLVSDGSHGCPLCKDLLARFPPQSVKMKRPFSSIPWDTSPELVKKLFKVLQFLYGNAATIEICPFTLYELAHAFTDKDSMLLGMIHVSLLKLLLVDVEREVTMGLIFRSAKHGRFLSLLHFVRQQKFDIDVWSQSLNPLTWTEILRQVLVAAGFGSNPDTARRENCKKEKNQMAKYGLRPHTLKGELFTMLSKQGSGGLKVTELAKSSQIVTLDLPDAKEEIEELICSTLSSDITLFEKIASSAYRLRVSPHVKGKEVNLSDTEDAGSVDDDDFGDNSGSSSIDESDGSEEFNSAGFKKRIVKYKNQHKRTVRKLTEHTEIDESCSGEAWMLGLMEGEYSDLSIDEKLDALMALIELAGDCLSLRTEESAREAPAILPHMLYHGSGAKIKKSSTNHLLMSKDSESCSAASKENSSKTMSTMAKDKSGPDVHLMQSVYLGSDRRYNSYWLFLGPCDINDPGHRQVYFESSEDGHWEVISTTQALDALLTALDCRGTREARLFVSLDKREMSLCQAMDDCINSEYKTRQTSGSTSSGDGSSPISDVDNILDSVESPDSHSDEAGAGGVEIGKSRNEKKQKWDRLQAFDGWVWHGFYSALSTIKKRNCSFTDSLTRCAGCHDLYLKDEKHCRICHTTFELDFDLEERYAIHVATCTETQDRHESPNHKLLPSQLQALKAVIHALEAGLPEVALSAAWRRSAHKLWVKRLLRTSSLPELLQIVTDFVGAINEEWLYECASSGGTKTAVDDIIVYFQTMPQTTSAVALWMIKLDNLIASHLEKVESEQAADTRPRPKHDKLKEITINQLLDSLRYA